MSESISEEEIQYKNEKKRRRIKIDEEDINEELDELENLVKKGDESEENNSDRMTELDEEDLNLIEENTGIDILKSKRKRVLFEESDEEEENIIKKKKNNILKVDNVRKTIDEYDDDLNDFIVDDMDGDDDEEKSNKIYTRPKERLPIRISSRNYDEDINDDIDEDDIINDKNIDEVYEPAALEKYHLTEKDKIIRTTDIPERLQRRPTTIKDTINDNEVHDEANYIYSEGFIKKILLDYDSLYAHLKNVNYHDVIQKIKNVLILLKNEKLDVPFIIHYRKESFQPELTSNDIWKIYDSDIEYYNMIEKRNNVSLFLTQMRNYQTYFSTHAELDQSYELGEPIELSHIERVNHLCRVDEINDAYNYFVFNYLSILKEIYSSIKTNETLLNNPDLNLIDMSTIKLPVKFNYSVYCNKTKLSLLIKQLGLDGFQLGQNIYEQYPKYIPNKPTCSSKQLASQIMSGYFKDENDILINTSRIWGLSLANNFVIRSYARNFYYKYAKISCSPTSKGILEIDDLHPYCQFKYLRNKPIHTFTPENFIKLYHAHVEKLIKISITSTNEHNQTLWEYCQPFYERDDYSLYNNEYNKLRNDGVKYCFEKLLFPYFQNEFMNYLHKESQEYINHSYSKTFLTHINITSDYEKVRHQFIFAISVPPYRKDGIECIGSCAIVGTDGSYIESFNINSGIFIDIERCANKSNYELNVELLRTKINEYNPSSIVFNLSCYDIIYYAKSLKEKIFKDMTFNNDDNIPPNIEIVNYLIPNICGNSKLYSQEFPFLSIHAKRAISAARFSIDPLLEVAQLFQYKQDITSIILHSLYRLLDKEIMYKYLERQLIDIVNNIGVDIHRCYNDNRYSNLLQYISGLGPSKALYILNGLRKSEQKIEDRTSLITDLRMGPCVFINCAGFINIPLNLEYDNYKEPFDNSRIHPESYQLSKLLISQVYNCNVNNQSNIIDSLINIQVNNDILQKFDLNKFIAEHAQHKKFTILDIKEELSHPYSDKRFLYRALNDSEIFWYIASNGVHYCKESNLDPDMTLAINRIIPVTVIKVMYKKPNKISINDSIVKSDNTGKYYCPFCIKSIHTSVDNVWKHANSDCPGYIFGIRVRLDCGLYGFIYKDNIEDITPNTVQNDFCTGVCINARIIGVNESKFSVDLSTKLYDSIIGNKNTFKDEFYDVEKEQMQKNIEHIKEEKLKNRVTYKKKLILHPLFRNITYEESQKVLNNTECIIRPSSKGDDQLTLSIKISNEIFVHFNIKEEEKPSEFVIGRKLLLNGEYYDDLDEIQMRFIKPYINYCKKVINHKNYLYISELDKNKLQNELKKLLQNNNYKIPYLLSLSKSYPGRFYLAYYIKNNVNHEYISINYNGYRIRDIWYNNIDSVITYFKTINNTNNLYGYDNTYNQYNTKIPNTNSLHTRY